MTKIEDTQPLASSPLSEMYVGVFFDAPPNLMQIHTYELWDKIRKDYPKIQEHAPLQAAFETFGGVDVKSMPFLMPNSFMRSWFMTNDSHSLFQFQNNALYYNWRKLEKKTEIYPGYETIINRFVDTSSDFFSFFKENLGQDIAIRQAEITYMNKIRLSDFNDCWDIFTFVSSPLSGGVDEFMLGFKKIVFSENAKPIGRIIVEARSQKDEFGEPFLSLNLTVRGKPEGTTFEDALAFILKGRHLLRETFAQIISDSVRTQWERQ